MSEGISGSFSSLGMDIRLPAILSGELQEVGIWWSVALVWFVGTVFSFFYYRTGKWKSKTVIKTKAEND